jgi:hypothetical protein
MAIQTFVASTVLTAAQMNALQGNDYNQTVSTKTASYTLVAADKGTRVVMNSASATTITVNTSLFSAGDTLVLQNISTGVCTVTAGTATVSTAGSLAIPQNGSGILYFTSAGVSIFYPSAGAPSASGLTLVKTQTIGTTVSSVEVTGAFSATYDNYLITVNGGVASTTNYLQLKLGSTVTGYYYWGIYGIASSNTVNIIRGANQASFDAIGSGTTNQLITNIDIKSPNLAKTTHTSSMNFQAETTGLSISQNGFLDNATQYTAFTFLVTTGTITGGTIRVYGYQNS